MIKIVDLFSGAGGFTFGFKYKIHNHKFILRDEFVFSFANEYDKDAANSFRANYPEIKMVEDDIRNIDLNYINANNLDIENIDVIIGGPPCQSFSFIGNRINDDRAKLYNEYNRIINIIRPKAFIFENVVGILSMKDENENYVIDNIEKSFNENGYRVYKKILNALDFGIPQTRKRVFIVGVRNDIEKEYVFPNGIINNKRYLKLSQAISDLPIISESHIKNRKRSYYRTTYQKLLHDQRKITLHESGFYGNRMKQIIEALGLGEGKEDINNKVNLGLLPKELYLTSGYHNTYARLFWDKPGSTITNSLNRPSSIRCIHPFENRALTTREGARIQSFPDSYIFKGSMTSINKQIGNAVPPILSIFVANSIIDFFK